MKHLMMIAPNDFDDVEKKGVIHHYEMFLEDGFFQKFTVFFPFGRRQYRHELKGITFFQYGWKSGVGFLDKLKILKAIRVVWLLFKVFVVFPFQLKNKKITLIRATDPYMMGLIGLWYGRVLHVPLTVSIHSDYETRYLLDGARGSFVLFGSRRLARALERFVYRHCDLILPIRDYIGENISTNFGIDRTKIVTFPHGISLEGFDSCENRDIKRLFSIPQEKKIISFIGRLSKENYIYDIIEAAKKLKQLRCDFLILLVGKGNEYSEVERQLSQEQLGDVVKQVGFQDRETVINIRRQSEASLCLMGGFSLIEACAAARPVISYDVEWHYELVKDGISGYLIKERDIAKLVEKLDYLLENPDVATRMGREARGLAESRHDIKKTTKIKQEIYQRVLDEVQ